MSYISAAELARRCEVTRAAVTLAIKQHRISPGKVRREGKNVLIDAAHGMSVLGHHRHRRPAAAPPAPAPVITDDDLGGLLAWGAPAVEGEDEHDELTGAAEVADLEEQIEMWNKLVNKLEGLLSWWEVEYGDARRWISSTFVTEAMKTVEEHPVARHAVCEARNVLIKQLDRLDEAHIQTKFRR